MGIRHRWSAFIAVLALLSCTSGAFAAQAAVKDDAGFFSTGAVGRAESQLQALRQQSNHTVMVETYPTLPPELRGQVDGNDVSKRRAYAGFAERRAGTLGADVYVLIIRDPAHLEVTKHRSPARSGLTDSAMQRMRDDLLTRLHANQFDDALTNMAASLNATYTAGPAQDRALPTFTPPDGRPAGQAPAAPRAPQRDAPEAAPPTNAGGGSWLSSLGCVGFLVIGVVLLLVFSLVRRLFARRQTPPPLGGPGQPYGQGGYGQAGYGQGGYGGGGGGFGRGVGGGILGGLLGSWIGGNVFGQGHQPADPSSSTGPAAGDPGGTDASGYTSTGGDFGSSDASNSFGSTDAGSDYTSSGGDFGGDSGGGDSGGGGDF